MQIAENLDLLLKAGAFDEALDILEAEDGIGEGALFKGAGHKYVRRIPISGGGAGGKKYRYIYSAAHALTDLHPDGPQVGEKLRAKDGDKDGHYEVKDRHEDGTVTIRHDETGNEKRVTGNQLRMMMEEHHGAQAKTERVAARVAYRIMAQHGSPKQQERALATLKRRDPDWQEHKSSVDQHEGVDRRAAELVRNGPGDMSARGIASGAVHARAAELAREGGASRPVVAAHHDDAARAFRGANDDTNASFHEQAAHNTRFAHHKNERSEAWDRGDRKGFDEHSAKLQELIDKEKKASTVAARAEQDDRQARSKERDKKATEAAALEKKQNNAKGAATKAATAAWNASGATYGQGVTAGQHAHAGQMHKLAAEKADAAGKTLDAERHRGEAAMHAKKAAEIEPPAGNTAADHAQAAADAQKNGADRDVVAGHHDRAAAAFRADGQEGNARWHEAAAVKNRGPKSMSDKAAHAVVEANASKTAQAAAALKPGGGFVANLGTDDDERDMGNRMRAGINREEAPPSPTSQATAALTKQKERAAENARIDESFGNALAFNDEVTKKTGGRRQYESKEDYSKRFDAAAAKMRAASPATAPPLRPAPPKSAPSAKEPKLTGAEKKAKFEAALADYRKHANASQEWGNADKGGSHRAAAAAAAEVFKHAPPRLKAEWESGERNHLAAAAHADSPQGKAETKRRGILSEMQRYRPDTPDGHRETAGLWDQMAQAHADGGDEVEAAKARHVADVVRGKASAQETWQRAQTASSTAYRHHSDGPVSSATNKAQAAADHLAAAELHEAGAKGVGVGQQQADKHLGEAKRHRDYADKLKAAEADDVTSATKRATDALKPRTKADHKAGPQEVYADPTKPSSKTYNVNDENGRLLSNHTHEHDALNAHGAVYGKKGDALTKPEDMVVESGNVRKRYKIAQTPDGKKHKATPWETFADRGTAIEHAARVTASWRGQHGYQPPPEALANKKDPSRSAYAMAYKEHLEAKKAKKEMSPETVNALSASIKANKSGTAEDHAAAEQAHMTASQTAKDKGDRAAADRHDIAASKHRKAGKEQSKTVQATSAFGRRNSEAKDPAGGFNHARPSAETTFDGRLDDDTDAPIQRKHPALPIGPNDPAFKDWTERDHVSADEAIADMNSGDHPADSNFLSNLARMHESLGRAKRADANAGIAGPRHQGFSAIQHTAEEHRADAQRHYDNAMAAHAGLDKEAAGNPKGMGDVGVDDLADMEPGTTFTTEEGHVFRHQGKGELKLLHDARPDHAHGGTGDGKEASDYETADDLGMNVRIREPKDTRTLDLFAQKSENASTMTSAADILRKGLSPSAPVTPASAKLPPTDKASSATVDEPLRKSLDVDTSAVVVAHHIDRGLPPQNTGSVYDALGAGEVKGAEGRPRFINMGMRNDDIVVTADRKPLVIQRPRAGGPGALEKAQEACVEALKDSYRDRLLATAEDPTIAALSKSTFPGQRPSVPQHMLRHVEEKSRIDLIDVVNGAVETLKARMKTDPELKDGLSRLGVSPRTLGATLEQLRLTPTQVLAGS